MNKTALEIIKKGQKEWADKYRKEIKRDQKYNNYFDDYNSNLFEDLNNDAINSFKEGKGNELKDGKYPAPMKSLISSSALCVNIFQYFINNKEVTKLLEYCGCEKIDNSAEYKIEFEHKKAAISIPAHLDVAILPKSENRSYFFESKFVEFYRKKTDNILEKSYYQQNKDLITEFNNFVQEDFRINFAEKLKDKFHYLDSVQLLKHTFALMKAFDNDTDKFELIYVFFELPNNKIAEKHLKEIDIFKKDVLRDNINFRYLSYNTLIEKLKETLNNTQYNNDYINYLYTRYIQPYEQQL